MYLVQNAISENLVQNLLNCSFAKNAKIYYHDDEITLLDKAKNCYQKDTGDDKLQILILDDTAGLTKPLDPKLKCNNVIVFLVQKPGQCLNLNGVDYILTSALYENQHALRGASGTNDGLADGPNGIGKNPFGLLDNEILVNKVGPAAPLEKLSLDNFKQEKELLSCEKTCEKSCEKSSLVKCDISKSCEADKSDKTNETDKTDKTDNSLANVAKCQTTTPKITRIHLDNPCENKKLKQIVLTFESDTKLELGNTSKIIEYVLVTRSSLIIGHPYQKRIELGESCINVKLDTRQVTNWLFSTRTIYMYTISIVSSLEEANIQYLDIVWGLDELPNMDIAITNTIKALKV